MASRSDLLRRRAGDVSPARAHGYPDMHSGMFGAAALNATRAHERARGRRSRRRRLPAGRASRRCDAAVEEELAAWARPRPAPAALSLARRRSPLEPGRLLPPHVREHVARRERHRERLARPGQDGAPLSRLARTCPSGSRPARSPRRSTPRSSGWCAGLPGRGARDHGQEHRPARPDAPGRSGDQARGRCLRAGGRCPPLLVRTGGTLPIYAGLVARGLPTLATGFGIESECNVHAPNENVPEDAIDLGVATLREVFAGSEALGSSGPPSRAHWPRSWRATFSSGSSATSASARRRRIAGRAPSTEKQLDLSRMLVDELRELGCRRGAERRLFRSSPRCRAPSTRPWWG